MRLIEIPLHGVGTLKSDPLVDARRSRIVGMTFDLKKCALGVGQQLHDEFIDPRLCSVRQGHGIKRKVALVFTQHDLIDKFARGGGELVGAGPDGLGFVLGGGGAFGRCCGGGLGVGGS